MERYERIARDPEDQIEIDQGEWWWVKEDGTWKAKLLPPTGQREDGFEERERRDATFLQLMRELEDQRKYAESQNEGFLRDHPRYRELFIKWAIRYLRTQGFNAGRYNGEVSERGYLLDVHGDETNEKLTYLVKNAREWIDEKIEIELQLSENFVDITNDYEKREREGVEPLNDGWYNADRG